MFGEWMFWINAGNLEHSIIKHHHTQGPKGNPGHNYHLVEIMDSKAPRFLDPIFDKRIAQGMNGFRFGEIGTLYYNAIFAYFALIHTLDKQKYMP